MSNFLHSCKTLFQEENLYKIFGIDKNASASEIKKAYYRLSLRYHPDKVDQHATAAKKSETTVKFQMLSKIYSILSDSERKAVYDETGEVGDDDSTDSERDWWQYWRVLFKKITIDDIKEYECNYKGSVEEAADCVTAYEACDGDLKLILDHVLLTSTEDHDRIYSIIQKKVAAGELEKKKKFKRLTKKQLTNRTQQESSEAAEAEEALKELGLPSTSGEDGLKALIKNRAQTREQEFNGFCDALMEKYATKEKPKRPKSTSSDSKKKTKK